MPADRNCDGGIWGSGSGGEGGFGHTDYGGGGLPDGGEDQGARHQPDFGRAPGDRGVWGEELGQDFEKPEVESTQDLVEAGKLLEAEGCIWLSYTGKSGKSEFSSRIERWC